MDALQLPRDSAESEIQKPTLDGGPAEKMNYVRLGNTGLKVSPICLGALSFGNSAEWMIEAEPARKIVKRALDLGINFFDTANVYSHGRSEEIIGESLSGYGDEVVIATKVGEVAGVRHTERGLSRRHIMREVERSLRRLKTDHIDLYQTHLWDYETPIEETLRTLGDLIQRGKVRYIGASSMFAWQFAKALFTSDLIGVARFASMQNHYNLCYREDERELIPFCRDQGAAILPWSPLARGFLGGRYRRGELPRSVRYETDRHLGERFFRAEDFDILESTRQVASEKAISTAQVAIAWLFHKGATAPIIGATKEVHVEEAAESLSVRLNADDLARLERPYKIRSVVGHF